VVFQILTILFCTCAALQCGYFFFFFVRVLRFRNHGKTPAARDTGVQQPVSLIICARNEAAALQRNLPLILAQRYGNTPGKTNYEVIVVDDASTDDTVQVLQELGREYGHLRTVRILPGEPRSLPGKKFALGRGISSAEHELLLFTDADCRPAGPDWLALMTAPLRRGRQIAAGYGGFEMAPGLLNRFVRWETMHTFLQYGTYALAGVPYMAAGRNLACTREAMARASADPVWGRTASGDDDLMMRTVATGGNTEIVCTPGAFTLSRAKTRWAGWLKQKQRHLSTGKYYRPHIRFLLGGYALSHAGMWLGAVVLMVSGHFYPAAMLLALRCLLYWTLWTFTARILHERRLLFLFPLFDFGWMIYNFALTPYIFWKSKLQWT